MSSTRNDRVNFRNIPVDIDAFKNVTEQLLNFLTRSEQQEIGSSNRIIKEIRQIKSPNARLPRERSVVIHISDLLIDQHMLASGGMGDVIRNPKRTATELQRDMMEYFQRLRAKIQHDILAKFQNLSTKLAHQETASTTIHDETNLVARNTHDPGSRKNHYKFKPSTLKSRDKKPDPEQQELASTTIHDETHSEQLKPTATILGNVSEKKSPEAIMSPEQQKQQLQQKNKQKPYERRNKKKGLPDTSKDQCQTRPEQQESTTKIEEKDHSLVQEEPPINFDQPTWELRAAEKKRGARLNCKKVAKLSEIGTIRYHLIPTRPYWLSMVLDDWGTTDDQIKASIASSQVHLFRIEVCGWHQGYGVILRDNKRNPIIVISKVPDEYVSPFYHELLGVSQGLKLALKYKFYHFGFHCISEDIAGYVMQSWRWKYACGCPERDNLENPNEKRYYCVKCSKSRLSQVGEGKNADKILSLIDEIFCDALELERQGNFPCFRLSSTKLSRAQAVWHLANSGIDQELRIDEIDEDEEIAEMLYKEVYGHGSMEELMFQQKMEKEERQLEEDLYRERTMAAQELSTEECFRVEEINKDFKLSEEALEMMARFKIQLI